MARRTRLTVFTRFLIAMIIIVPGAYILSNYLTNDDFDIKDLLNFNKSTQKQEVVDNRPTANTDNTDHSLVNSEEAANLKARIQRLEDEKSTQNARIEKLYKELEACRETAGTNQ